ncbi:dihydrofolate reductase family protein [Paenibacillus aceris]|uniref:Dihydrofolate reductase n=1 Tax=Paenibacillus aceris TaxID=869555 RepID=A0ABS4I114_9BACL|nr:dihydrofolate reductase family protein [Paenibacillus aceris]MBP1964500.1 dihydrofolate reductase [Paenibacillus aceris]NHW35790.1 dihydrofolate reductase [Paenibacillus aceris]
MRKVILFNRTSIDGFFTGPKGEIDWFIHDPEVDKAAHEMMDPDTIFFGRVTYQMFESYWPQVAKNPNAPMGAKALANELNEMTKIVFSTSLTNVTWENSKLVNGDLAKSVLEIKQSDGADIVIFGSGSIVQQLTNEGLIDEYLITVTPVVLGAGKPLFHDVKAVHRLKLKETRSFASGNVLLHYEKLSR